MIDPSKYGAETSADIAAFLLGTFLGGTLDAVANIAGFAEPLVFAPLCGAGTLGLKKAIFDVPRHREERTKKLQIEKLEFEAEVQRRRGDEEKARELEDAANSIRFE